MEEEEADQSRRDQVRLRREEALFVWAIVAAIITVISLIIAIIEVVNGRRKDRELRQQYEQLIAFERKDVLRDRLLTQQYNNLLRLEMREAVREEMQPSSPSLTSLPLEPRD